MDGREPIVGLTGIQDESFENAQYQSPYLVFTRGDGTTQSVNIDSAPGNSSNWALYPAVSDVNMNSKNISSVATINATTTKSQNYEITGNGSYKGANNMSALPINTEYPIITAGNGVGMWGKKLTNNDMEALMFKTHYVSGTPNTALSITQYGDVGMGEFTSTDNIRAKLHIVNTGTFDCLRVDDQASDTTYFKVDSEGRCGIGTGGFSLTDTLTVNGSIRLGDANLGAGHFKGVNVGWYVGNNTSYPLCTPQSHENGLYLKRISGNYVATQLWTAEGVAPGNGVPRLTVMPVSGNTGIGTEDPQAKLHIVQTGTQDAFRVDDVASDTTVLRVNQNGQMCVGGPIDYEPLPAMLNVAGDTCMTGVHKYFSDDAPKIYWTTYNDNGSKVSHSSGWTVQFDGGNKSQAETGNFAFATSNGSGFANRFVINSTGISAYVPLNMSSQKITNVAICTNSTDAANKAYVDSQVVSGGSTKNIYIESSLSNPTTDITIDFASASINYNSIVITVNLTSSTYYKQIYFANYGSPLLIGKRITLFITYNSNSGSYCNVFAPDGNTYILQNVGGYNKAIELIGGGIGNNPTSPYWRVVVSTT